MKRSIVLYGAVGLAISLGFLTAFAEPAAAQSVMRITGNKVGIGLDAPTELLHLFSTDPELKMRLEQSGASNAWAYSVVSTGPPSRPNSFRISKQGSGGPEVDIIGRFDPGGQPTMLVNGSIQATNVTFSSSRALKTDIAPLDGREMLERIARLPMAQWRLKTEDESRRHYGPMAEDFSAIFEIGDGETISMVDVNGIALAAIQALQAEVRSRDEQIARLAEMVESLQQAVDSLRTD